MEFSVKVSNTIPAKLSAVFDGIVQAEILSKYFVSKSTGDLSLDQNIKWYWKDCDVSHNISVNIIEQNTHIQFDWDATGKMRTVDLHFETQNTMVTKLTIKEHGFRYEPNDVKSAMEQTQGWTDFLCSLKAYHMNGLQLRSL